MIKHIQNFIIAYAPDCIFIPLMNLNNTIKSRKAVVTRPEDKIYAVHDGTDTIHTGRRVRLGRYFFGIQAQCTKLAKEYLMNDIPCQSGDVVIDCGANNGEIGIWARHKDLVYYAFEPEALEARCCDLNNYDGKEQTNRKGLWHEPTILHWYSKPDTADSSLIKIDGTDHVHSIETTTLDDFLTSHGIERVKLLKLEAEGAEPEVLRGALHVLHRIEYIAVDCGYERGIEKNHTFMEIYDTLKNHNFEIVAAEFKRVVFLFRNTAL